MPSGTYKMPRGTRARAQGPTGPFAGTPVLRQERQTTVLPATTRVFPSRITRSSLGFYSLYLIGDFNCFNTIAELEIVPDVKEM